PAVVEPPVLTTLTSQGGSSAQNTVWPPHVFGYTFPGYMPTEIRPALQNTQALPNQVETLNTQPRVSPVQQGFVSQQENLDDPRNAYQ
ncbi:hypothetical protein A2U01_0083200, partial [Trifolium medium]|nr:hypothetical protein [Trifolium medium]